MYTFCHSAQERDRIETTVANLEQDKDTFRTRSGQDQFTYGTGSGQGWNKFLCSFREGNWTGSGQFGEKFTAGPSIIYSGHLTI